MFKKKQKNKTLVIFFFFQNLICTLPPELNKIIYKHYITNICRNKILIHEELQVFNSIKNTPH